MAQSLQNQPNTKQVDFCTNLENYGLLYYKIIEPKNTCLTQIIKSLAFCLPSNMQKGRSNKKKEKKNKSEWIKPNNL